MVTSENSFFKFFLNQKCACNVNLQLFVFFLRVESNIYFEYFRCSLHYNFELFCLLHLKGVESLTKEIEVKFLICRSLRSVIDPQCLWF